MDVHEARSRLATGIEAIECFVAGIGDDEAAFRPDASTWSVLDVLAHLVDEEAHDFRARMRAVLQEPPRPWPEVDPEAAVAAARGAALGARALLERFRDERAVSLAWLAGLDGADLERAHRGDARDLRAGDLLAAWVAHDLLHLRQLAAVRLAWWARRAEPFALDYAGRLPAGVGTGTPPSRLGSST